jgi:hypothetical protein
MDIFEILVPLIFAAIYFFGNMFSKGSGENDAPRQEPRRRKGEDPEAAGRQRDIREEIRRKIMERRQAEQGEGSQQSSREVASRDESNADRQLRERRAAAEQRRQQNDPEVHMPESVPAESYPASRSPEPTAAKPETRSSDGSFSWDTSDDIYGDEMRERLKKIEATKRQAERLKKQAEARRRPHEQSKSTAGPGSGALFQGSVIENLRSANAARAAFIYGEVLGPPISQRKAQSIPGLEQ